MESKDHYLHQTKEIDKNNRQDAKEGKISFSMRLAMPKAQTSTNGRQGPEACNAKDAINASPSKIEDLQCIKDEDCPATANVDLRGGGSE